MGRDRPWQTHDYGDVATRMQTKPSASHTRFPCVTPRWDNTPRRGRTGLALTGDSPTLYRDWVAWASQNAPTTTGGESLVFVNAWNEWAEGAYLEPCRELGTAYLDAHLEGRGLGSNET